MFSIYDPLGLKLGYFTPLKNEFSDLNKHKFRQSFKDTLNPLCASEAEVETTEHFLLRLRLIIFQQFSNLTAKDAVLLLLYSSRINSSENSNQDIINFVIKYLKLTGRFDRSIFKGNQ